MAAEWGAILLGKRYGFVMEWLLTALVIGLMGSLHCVGMCGPLALALHARLDGHKGWNNLLYNSGRLITYSILGVLMATFGRGLAWAGLQQTVSIVTGSVILLFIVFQAFGHFSHNLLVFQNWLGKPVKKWLGLILKNDNPGGFLLAGMINGLLPCGLVYLALSGALNTNSVLEGGLFMLFFGIGTFPAMWLAGYAGHLFNLQKRIQIRKIIPWFSAAVAVLLIVRGMNLGIPYVSPHTTQQGAAMECCQQPTGH